MDGLHDHFPQTGGGVGGAAGQADLLGLVVAAPDRRSVVAGIAAEPAVAVAGGGTGLAGDILSAKDRRAAGANVGSVIQAVVHIVGGFLTEHPFALLGIVQHQLTLTVVDLGEQPRFPEHAVVGEGAVGLGHLPHRGAHGQRAQSQGGLA